MGPRRVVAAARAAAATRADAGAKAAKGGAASASSGRSAGGGAPRPASRQKGKSFADVVREMGLVANDESDSAMEGTDSEESDVTDTKEERYWRERRAAAARAGPLAADDLAECDAKLGVLVAARRKARPWAHRVQAATDAFQKTEAKRKSTAADLAAARAAWAAFEAAHLLAESEHREAASVLETVRAEVGTAGNTSQAALPVAVGDAWRSLQKAVQEAGFGEEQVAQLFKQAGLVQARGRSPAAVSVPGHAFEASTAGAGGTAPATARTAKNRSRSRARDEGLAEEGAAAGTRR